MSRLESGNTYDSPDGTHVSSERAFALRFEKALGKEGQHGETQRISFLESPERICSDLEAGVLLLRNLKVEQRSDPDIVLAALKHDPSQIHSAHESLRTDRSFMMKAVHINGHALQGASDRIAHDKEVVTAAVKSHYEAFQYASADLRRDEDFVRSLCRIKEKIRESAWSITDNPGVFQFADKKLRADRDFVESLIDGGSAIYPWCSPELKNDRDIAARSFAKHGHVLEHAPDSFRRSRELVQMALESSRGTALQYASPELARDRDLNLLAASCADFYRGEKEFIHWEYREDDKFLIEAFGRNKNVYRIFSDTLKCDRRLAYEFIQASRSLGDVPARLAEDPEFVSKAVQRTSYLYRMLPATLRKNEQIALTAISVDSRDIANLPRPILTPELQIKIASTSLASREALAEVVGKLPRSVVEQYEKLESAYATLGLDARRPKREGTIAHRFDNSREIIRGRYQVSDDATRERLIDTLGEEYFRNLPSPAKDPRPLVVIIQAKSDFNGAFEQPVGVFGMRDNIDSLTKDHAVAYYEVGDKEEFVRAFRQATAERKADVFYLAGHGSPTFVQLEGERGISSADGPFLAAALRGRMRDNGLIILASCSTGKEINEGRNIGQMLHDVWPSTTLYAPKRDINLIVELDGDGMVKPPVYFSDLQTIKDNEVSILTPRKSAVPKVDVTTERGRALDRMFKALEKEGVSFTSGSVDVLDRETGERQEVEGIHVKMNGRTIGRFEPDSDPERIAALCVGERFADILTHEKNEKIVAEWKTIPLAELTPLKNQLKSALGYTGHVRVRFDTRGGLLLASVENSEGDELARCLIEQGKVVGAGASLSLNVIARGVR